MFERSCRNRVLAHGAGGCIQQCLDCGVISLHLGAVTLRLDAATTGALWATLGEALHELHRLRSSESRPHAPGQA